jgi:hypothetical protein
MEWRKLYLGIFCHLCSLLNIVRIIKSRRMRLMEMINSYQISAGKVLKSWHRLEIILECVHSVQFVRIGWGFVKTVMNFFQGNHAQL